MCVGGGGACCAVCVWVCAGGVCVGGGVLAVLCVFVWVGVGVVVCWMWLPVSGPTLTVVEYEDSQFGTRN